MTDRIRHLAVGMTAIGGLGGIFFLLILFGSVPAWLESGYEVHVRLANASGLTPDSRVKLNGIDIGRVIGVRLDDPPRLNTVITALIREDVHVPLGVRVQAQSPLLGGNPTLAFKIERIAPGTEGKNLPIDGSAVIEGEALTMVSQFAGEMQAALSEPTAMLKRVTKDFQRLSEEWTLVGANINRLIEHRTAAQVDSGSAAANLSSVLARADQDLTELRKLIDGLNRWVGDTELWDEVHATVASVRQTSEKIGDGADQTTVLIDQTRLNLDRLTARYTAVADEAAGLITLLRPAIEKVRDGDGTVGKLLHDPALYNRLNDAAERLEQVLVEGRLLIQKWSAEGLGVQF